MKTETEKRTDLIKNLHKHCKANNISMVLVTGDKDDLSVSYYGNVDDLSDYIIELMANDQILARMIITAADGFKLEKLLTHEKHT